MNKRIVLYGVVVLSLLLAAMPTAAQGTVFWTAEYFNNANLAGAPAFVLTENTITHDWGAGSPSPLIPTDYFSVRWTSVQTLAAGTYQFTIRADDGVRVFIDGTSYLNAWQPSPGGSSAFSATLAGGQHTVVVEYFEAAGLAYLQYEMVNVIGNTQAIATINTTQLNVRNLPNPYTGAVITRVTLGAVYPIIGRNADSSWIQLNVNGIAGWVNVTYVVVTNLSSVPITDSGTRPTPPPPPPPNPQPGANATVTAYFLNVRQTPDPVHGVIVGRISRGQTYPIIGKNPDASWLLLNVNNTVGWVRSSYVSATSLGSVPIVSSNTQPIPSVAIITTPRLNVRAVPDPINGLILTRVSQGETYPAVGRNAAGTWVQINVSNMIGWVNVRYASVSPNIMLLPVTG
ncbi:MAG: SH3 domain-containing protein [Anaerolineae bacterium]